MNKKTILGLLTGAAIVAATTGSYAAWDTLEKSATVSVALRNPVTISNALIQSVTESGDLGAVPTYTTSIKVKAENVPSDKNVEWTFTPTVKSGEIDVTNKVDVTVGNNNTAAVTSEEQSFPVTVTPHEDATDLAGTSLTVEINAKLGTATEANPS